MTVIVTDAGFAPEDWNGGFATADAIAANDCPQALDIGPDADIAALGDLPRRVTMIRIAFPSFADGRGFTLARQLRHAGFRGRLRAAGHVIADQYAMVRRAGFDEVEIDDALAARQPEPQWRARDDWRQNDYQARLGRYDHRSRQGQQA